MKRVLFERVLIDRVWREGDFERVWWEFSFNGTGTGKYFMTFLKQKADQISYSPPLLEALKGKGKGVNFQFLSASAS